MDIIIEKAQELGKLIAESEIKKEAVRAADEMNNDETAVLLLASYNQMRSEQLEKLKGTQPSKEEIADFKKLMDDEFKKIMTNDKIASYVAANKALDSLMEQVNAVMAFYISGGEDSQSGCSSCGGSCSDCKGCH